MRGTNQVHVAGGGVGGVVAQSVAVLGEARLVELAVRGVECRLLGSIVGCVVEVDGGVDLFVGEAPDAVRPIDTGGSKPTRSNASSPMHRLRATWR